MSLPKPYSNASTKIPTAVQSDPMKDRDHLYTCPDTIKQLKYSRKVLMSSRREGEEKETLTKIQKAIIRSLTLIPQGNNPHSSSFDGASFDDGLILLSILLDQADIC